VATSPGLAIYDGHCGFCTWCVEQLLARSDARVVPWQSMGADQLTSLGLTEADVSARVYWVGADGRVAGGGAEAVGHALRACRGPFPLAGRVVLLPFVLPVAEVVYRFVARHRGRLPGVQPALKRDDPAPRLGVPRG